MATIIVSYKKHGQDHDMVFPANDLISTDLPIFEKTVRNHFELDDTKPYSFDKFKTEKDYTDWVLSVLLGNEEEIVIVKPLISDITWTDSGTGVKHVPTRIDCNNSMLDGEFIAYNDDGVLSYWIIYKNGEEMAQWKKNNGEVEYTEAPIQNSIRLSQTELLIPVGEPRTESTSCLDVEKFGGLLVGKVYTTYRKRLYSAENGSIISDTCYHNGVIDGHRVEWWPNTGYKKSIENYNHGNLVGEKKYWLENGVQKIVQHYDNTGKLDGKFKAYHNNGELSMKTVYKNGLPDGDIVLYHNLKIPVQLNLHIGSKAMLKLEKFDVQIVIKHGFNKNGKFIGIVREWFLDKKIKQETTYNNQGEVIFVIKTEIKRHISESQTCEFDYYDETSYENMVGCIGKFFMYDGDLKTFLPSLDL